jgi:hypothetical protein
MSTSADHWIEMQPFGTATVQIELTRRGQLWHGQAARLASRNIERQVLANCVGADFGVVRHEVLKQAARSLKH